MGENSATRQARQPCGRPARRSSVLLTLASQHHYTGSWSDTSLLARSASPRLSARRLAAPCQHAPAFGFRFQHGASHLVSISGYGLARPLMADRRPRRWSYALTAAPRDDFLKAKPGEAGRSVLTSEAAGRSVLTRRSAKPGAVLTSEGVSLSVLPSRSSGRGLAGWLMSVFSRGDRVGA